MKNFKENLISVIVLTGLLGFFALGFYAMYWSNQQPYRSLAETGKVADAIVIDKLTSGGRSPSYSLVYEFDNGNRMTEHVGAKNFNVIKPGDEVEVCFNDTYLSAFVERCGTDNR